MERDVKFRGKRIDNGEFVCGSLIIWPNGDCSILLSSTRENKESGTEMEEHCIIHETVGEFTGLLDRNGKEIFEGDIIELSFSEYNKSIEFVTFKNGRFVTFDPAHPYRDESLCVFVKYASVIGNIYDNPELLKVGNHG